MVNSAARFDLNFILVITISCWSIIVYGFEQNDADDYLAKYGYMELLPAGSKTGSSPEVQRQQHEHRAKAIKRFQDYIGLPATGQLDDETRRLMLKPRCGLKDVLLGANRAAFDYKWDKTTLRWSLKTESAQLESGQVRTAVSRAFDVWSRVLPLNFVETNSNEDQIELQVGFGRGQHGDAWPFDGRGNVLAHASYPRDGRIHFDDDEQWAIDQPDKLRDEPEYVDFLAVAVHELGHALGLQHAPDRASIMYPVYLPPLDEEGRSKPVELAPSDIQTIQKLYGPRTSDPQPTDPPPPTDEPHQTSTHVPLVTIRPPEGPNDDPEENPDDHPTGASSCPVFQAALNGPDGGFYFFHGDSVWKKPAAGNLRTTRHTLHDLFPEGPTEVTAALTTSITQSVVLFQGREVYSYDWSPNTGKFTPRDSFPKTLTDKCPFEPKGAVQWKDGNLVLYNGDDFVTWDDYWNQVTLAGKMGSYFPNFPPDAQVSLTAGDKLYFLRGESYQIYDMHSEKLIESKKSIGSLIVC